VFLNDQRISDLYDSRVAFVRRRGFQANTINLGYEFQSATTSWWVRARPFVAARRLETTAGLVDESYVDPGLDLRLARDVSIYTYYSFHQDAFLGREYPYQFFATSITANTLKRITFEGRVQIGEGVNLVTFKPVAALDSQFLILTSRLNAPDGAPLFAQRIIRNRTNVQWTRNHGTRVISEYNSFTRQLSVSALYGWTPRPNTAIYAGYGDVLDRDLPDGLPNPRDRFERVRRTLFIKISYGLIR
jgi:hypothetical protein